MASDRRSACGCSASAIQPALGAGPWLLEARLTLGYINALWCISRARNDFSDIVGQVEGSVCAGFTGMLPWSEPTNRPFLRPP